MGAADEQLDVQYDQSGPNLTVYLSGELDLSRADDLAKEVIDRCDPAAQLVLDVSELTFCDSAGFRAFVTINNHLSGSGTSLVLYQPNASVRRLLAVTGLDKVLSIRG